MKRNETIKKKLRAEGVPQWRLAEAVGVSDQTLYRQLRTEISEERFTELTLAINEMTKGEENE